MRKTAKLVAAASMTALFASASLMPQLASAAGSQAAKGKEVAVNRKLGNCLGCHAMGDGISPGDIGPPLIAMKARFPDRAKLRAQLWDATENNPNSRMPPFGKHKALSEEQIDAIVDYLYTL